MQVTEIQGPVCLDRLLIVSRRATFPIGIVSQICSMALLSYPLLDFIMAITDADGAFDVKLSARTA